MSEDVELRRRARAEWASRLYARDEHEQADDDDVEFWLTLTPTQRLELVWELSVEGYALATGTKLDVGTRLPRSDYRVQRR